MNALEIPFRFEHHLLVFEGRLQKGQTVTLTLDTFAWPHVLRTELGQAQNWLTGHTESSEGVAGLSETQRAEIPELWLGQTVFRNLEALCDPLVGPIPFDLMLGAPLLADWVVQIDYPAKILRLIEPECWQPEVGAEVFELKTFEPGLPVLHQQLRLGGETIPWALLDTGNNAALVFSAELAKKLGLTPEGAAQGGGFGGQEMGFSRLTLPRLELGGQIWKDLQAILLPPEASPLLNQPDRVLLGNALFQAQVATWALPHSMWCLTSSPVLRAPC
ncbi:hypothetical protein COW36_18535 [bacterium (Candidatus Blackallbacteria) CG17_big_fil_post_rev_8_21_14_2_50_48_46]|uniref:Peptidase A2 domain-containing protein n=1 Tax=bacterium (Candidatus Blackallbacteria) CG17_big_fil_post_rev_8_21_14_2_50_48_46 TaxID=2014261 RepID=A0A2M7G156_9BACT|nr:MAG: hypothetical protein COW64_00200 [bacterium (Candidatus Blackallbacteria) CG18_big_fil_WC_8_21_14_2_50_49_26]PIW15412.1 MAG: hypothetical protein COW36_18535 [bacterium (Candidatus Blackallbacteria) CG17_big_fil_post_rev_8_21_14_2_50_48_46]PIW49727.1 MAG: hypothetical protein COW20_04830 [bacterium (Candidatus Blackallbacteria) CG13_big_fil_rev_8_21_14_2_50_49_14]